LPYIDAEKPFNQEEGGRIIMIQSEERKEKREIKIKSSHEIVYEKKRLKMAHKQYKKF